MTDAENRRPRWRDQELAVDERVEDLLASLTLEEKISQLTTASPAVERVGLPAFAWGGECLHGLVHTGRATVFPLSIAMAATFDGALIEAAADAIASEARAKHHDPVWEGPDGPRVGLSFWTPNINIFRDPRWGRGQETYGEDPFLTGTMGAAFVRGLQGDHPKYLKAAACAKHFAVHSGPEHLRQRFDADVTRKDLYETYLPAFKYLIDAGVECVMATYNAVLGEPCVISRLLLNDVLRDEWGFQGFVCSDGGAMSTPHKTHKVTKDAAETAARGMEVQLDLEIGQNAYPELATAIERGEVTEEQIDRSLRRLLSMRFRLGEFDDPADVPYTQIGREAVQCPEHISLAREVAVKSCVLLKNDGLLPFGPDVKTILVTGPNAADLQVLMGNYYRGVSAHLVSVLEGVVQAAPEGTAVTHMQGCYLKHPNDYDSTWVFGLAEWADAVVCVMGISPLQEGEGGECIGSPDGADRDGLELPPNQVEFLRKMKELDKPIVLVVTGGSPVAMPEAHDLADAVLFIWYPGEQGGAAVGDILFGKQSPSGRLPITFPASTDQVPPFEDYHMAKGRTYRYMTETPLYPFGFGLSYTQFEYGGVKLSADTVAAGQGVTVEVDVTNAGARESEEVVQLYVRDDEASVRVPNWSLCGFRRLRLRPGQTQAVSFDVTPQMLAMVNDAGERVTEPGTFTIAVGGSVPTPRAEELGAARPASATLTVAAF